MTTPAEDQQLINEMRRGSETAFIRIYEVHHGRIFRFALNMTGNTATAEEVTQEVFLHLMRKPRSFEPAKGPLSGYLFGIARNLSRHAATKNSFDVSLEDFNEQEIAPDVAADVLTQLSDFEALGALRTALLGLPEQFREVIVMCDLEQISYAEAAAVIGCPAGTIASRLHRGRAILKAKLARFSSVRTTG
jgi:RNA polymerase sigma-70 factor, ECF subfamily